MTITAVDETGISGGIEPDGTREYVVTYTVVSDSRTDTPIQVYNALPAPFSSLVFHGTVDAGVQLKRYNVTYLQEQDSNKVWQATCTYNNRPESGSTGGSVDVGGSLTQPEFRPPRIWGSFTGQVVEIERDYVGRPVVNPLGDKFRNAVRTRAQPDLNIEKTYTSINLATIGSSLDNANAEVFFGGAKGTFLLESAEWQQVYHGATRYYEVRYRFLYSPTGHRFRPRCEGPRYYFDTTDKEKLPIKSDDGFLFGDGYGNLNFDGTLRDADDPPLFYGIRPTGGGAAGATTEESRDGFQIYPLIDFVSTLGLPSGF